MEEEKLIRADGLLWDRDYNHNYFPLCPIDQTALINRYNKQLPNGYESEFYCEVCPKIYQISRSLGEEREFINRKLEAIQRKGRKIFNLDNEYYPLIENGADPEDQKYFAVAKLMKTRVGLRLVIYAGKKGEENKTQIFVEPEIKRLSFDQNNLNPSEVFTSIEATFADGTKHVIRKEI